MASDLVFTEEEIAIDEAVGYPKAYSKLCRDRSFGPYSHGPPFTFTPFALPQQEVLRAQELDGMFPIIDLKAKPTTKPKIFLGLLWKQLNHLGNAGFDPDIFRVDPYGNVLYYHADAASPLAWDIDHWFPLSRGGLTVASNLRILQWQVCKKKHNKLEFLVPWWDLQVGVSINQFLSIFASSNSDFRRRAFSWLFHEGECEELNACQTVDSHAFPQHFIESKQKVGLAPAALVLSRRESYDSSSALRSLDVNRKPRSTTPIITARKVKPGLKENEDPGMISNPYQAIVMARDSLRQREETAKMQAEIQKLDVEVDELRQKTEEEKVTIQDLELVLIKRRRRAEKCRRLAEAQSSYRSMLEKMIRDAMHQSVVYKEQVRLNQAAANALMARLEAQKAICDSSERELHKKFKQRDELEKQARPEWEQARKRSRMDDSLPEEVDNKIVLYLPGNKPKTNSMRKKSDTLLEANALYLRGLKSDVHFHKELRKFLEEEQKASEAGSSLKEDAEQEELEEGKKETTLRTSMEKLKESINNTSIAADEKSIDEKLHKLDIGENGIMRSNIQFPAHHEPEDEEDEESRKQRGKGNVEKWLHMLLQDAEEEDGCSNPQTEDNSRTDEIIRKLDIVYPQQLKVSKTQAFQFQEGMDEIDSQQVPLNGGGKREKEIVEMEVRKSFSNNGEQQGMKKKETLELKSRDKPMKNPPYRLRPEKSSNAHQGGYGNKEVENLDNHVVNERKEKIAKEKGLVRSESARTFRRIPSSPSLILSGMKKRVDCIGKKPLVTGDDADDSENYTGENNIIKSTIKTIKRAVKI
ncbi:hypothetical protein ACH5RR_024552 [Cinchona calisaya]|uniref:Trichohyalin n=1 Tax=Cinchona calisaya TaxID=153742 RepID=A0ABD2YX06_9GENT